MKEILQWVAIALIYIVLLVAFTSAVYFNVHTQVSYFFLILIFFKLYGYGDK
jgi:hypothetical protein